VRPALTLSVVSVCCAVVSVACGPASAEEQTLLGFFEAARALDSTRIAKYATVGFNPRTEGIVQTFTVTSAGQERDGMKDVTIDAIIRLPAGQMEQRTLVVTFQAREGRSIITGLRQAPASRTSREASSAQPK
jgi:hypothetical protein